MESMGSTVDLGSEVDLDRVCGVQTDADSSRRNGVGESTHQDTHHDESHTIRSMQM